MTEPKNRLENYQIIKKSATSNQETTDKMLLLVFLIGGQLINNPVFFKERPKNVGEFKDCLKKEIGEYQLSLIDDFRLKLFFLWCF